MEEEKQLAGEDRLSGEIVEVYRQPLPGEVVERYSRPLPGRPAAPGQPHRRRRTGLWIFLACLAVVLGVAAGSWIWYLLPAGSSADPFEYRYDHGWEEEEDASGAVTIPTYPFGEGAVLEVETDHGRELTAQEIYQRVNPSVVTVMVQLDDSVSVGTGVIFRADGYILTNYHVLAGGRDCTVAMDTGRTYEARYVAGDERNDLAVLKVELTGASRRHLRRQRPAGGGRQGLRHRQPAGRGAPRHTDRRHRLRHQPGCTGGRPDHDAGSDQRGPELRQFRRPPNQRLRPSGGHQHHQDEL